MKKDKKNLIICVEKNTTKRDLLRFGVKNLSNFYNVDIVNFHNLINKNKIVNSRYEKNLKNISDLLNLLKNKKYVCAIDYLRTSELHKTFKIKQILQENKVKLVQIHNGLLPIDKKFSKEKLFKVFNLKLLLNYFLKKLRKYFFSSQLVYDLSLISGLQAEIIYPETKLSKQKIYTHSFDYEATLNKKKIFKNKKLAIFLDENLISHPDYKIFGLNLKKYKNQYYSLIRKTLKKFELNYDLKIVVCIHPSLRNKNFKKYFKGFKCVLDKTEFYSRKASLVIMHQSTAISYSVIYNQPLVFLNYNGIKNSFLFKNINRMAYLFNKKPYFIDEKILLDRHADFKVDKKCYSKYLNNYIIHPKSKRNYSMWSLLVKTLNKK